MVDPKREPLAEEHITSILNAQKTMWIVATLFATFFAVFAKLIWTLKFPILILLPIAMSGFAIGSLNTLKISLSQFAGDNERSK